MKTATRIVVCLLIALTVTTSVAHGQRNPPDSERGAIVRVVSQWNSSCDASNREDWDNMVDNWYDDLTEDHGGSSWWRDGFYHNGNIVDSDFVDCDRRDWGNDCGSDRADEPDALLVGLHGAQGTGNRWNASVRVDEPGDGNCVSWQGHMWFDLDLEFLHLSSCHSMNHDVWPEWGDSFVRLHQTDGFHGVMYVTRFYSHRYEGFADDSFDTSMANAWVDNLYAYRWRGKNQCPVARGVGNGRENLWDRMDHERYNWVYDDPIGWNWSGYVYPERCDPRGASALPR